SFPLCKLSSNLIKKLSASFVYNGCAMVHPISSLPERIDSIDCSFGECAVYRGCNSIPSTVFVNNFSNGKPFKDFKATSCHCSYVIKSNVFPLMSSMFTLYSLPNTFALHLHFTTFPTKM